MKSYIINPVKPWGGYLIKDAGSNIGVFVPEENAGITIMKRYVPTIDGRFLVDLVVTERRAADLAVLHLGMFTSKECTNLRAALKRNCKSVPIDTMVDPKYPLRRK